MSPKISLNNDLLLSPSFSYSYGTIQYNGLYNRSDDFYITEKRFRVGLAAIYQAKYFISANFGNPVSKIDRLMGQIFAKDALNVLGGGRFDIGEAVVIPQVYVRTNLNSAHIRLSGTIEYKGFQFAIGESGFRTVYLGVGYMFNERYSFAYGYSQEVRQVYFSNQSTHHAGIGAILFKSNAKRQFIEGVGLI